MGAAADRHGPDPAMESLPVELVRLIFAACDLDAVKTLRLQSRVFALIGLDYLITNHVHVLGWKIERLHSISTHDRLKNRVRSVTLNLTEVDYRKARNISFFQHFYEAPKERRDQVTNDWLRYDKIESLRNAAAKFDSHLDLASESLCNLPQLTDLEVTFTKCPYAIDVLDDIFSDGLQTGRQMDREQAAKDMAVVAAALPSASLSSLTIDRFPLEILRLPDERRRWSSCASASFSQLSSLNLTIDPSALRLPAQRFKAIKGLGSMLRGAPNVTHLSLAFHTYGKPKNKHVVSFHSLLEGFTFEQLTNLKLEGMSCEEADLRDFLIRHASTLQRLRLGGRGLANTRDEGALGGIHLHRGTFRSLFASLRNRLPKLERLHLEGDFENVGLDGRAANEAYHFHGVTDDNWEEVIKDDCRNGRAPMSEGTVTRDCLEFERFILQGGRYPGTVPATAAPVLASAQ